MALRKTWKNISTKGNDDSDDEDGTHNFASDSQPATTSFEKYSAGGRSVIRSREQSRVAKVGSREMRTAWPIDPELGTFE